MQDPEQMKFFFEIFDAGLPRLGPGDRDSTDRALESVLSSLGRGRSDTRGMKILDLGCGNGAQTMILAESTDATILAVDNHRPYLDELERRAEALGVAERITTRLADMQDLGKENGPFDVVWSEGALYSMVFRDGLRHCFGLLVPGGALAVSELCWFRPDPPEECRAFLEEQYPAVTDIESNLAMASEVGYAPVGCFMLPESAWLVEYYAPLQRRLESLRIEYADSPEKMELTGLVQEEIDSYRRYSDWYGYVFYVWSRPG